MERSSERRVRLLKDSSPERRASARFPLALDLRYSVSHDGAPVETGSGRTIDMSSSGLRFTPERPLLAGHRLDLAIDWPARLDGGVQLQLIMTGVVAWTRGTETALRIQHHEFKTRCVEVKGRVRWAGAFMKRWAKGAPGQTG
jgi:hypothetical protein